MAPPMSSSNNDNNGDHHKTPPPSSAARGQQQQRSSLTPTRPINNYASTDTPITSAKRPHKKRTPVPPSSARKTPSSNSSGALRTPKTPLLTPAKANDMATSPSFENNDEKASIYCNEEALHANLSPMHNVRAVPRDSHHVRKAANSKRVDDVNTIVDSIATTESTLSIVTEDPTAAIAAAESSSNNSASWVGRKVDALFSPVLNFLNGGAITGGGSSGASGKEERDIGGGDKVATTATANNGSTNVVDPHVMVKEKKVEKKKTSDENKMVVQNMVREALLQARNDLQKEEEYNSRVRTDSSFDDIPAMTNTNSSGSNVVDADGDVTMADCYNSQLGGGGGKCDVGGKENTYDDYLKVTLNDNGDDEQEEEEYDDDEDDEDEFNPYMFIKSLPPYEYALPPGWRSRPKALPPADSESHPICLVLDLDETLVHCTVEPVADADMVFPVEFNGMNYQVHVRCRPFLTEFLEAVSRKFEVVIFTASQQVYADKLLDKIDPEGKYIHHRMFRDSCLPVEGNYLKDLTILGRDLSKAVLVDNSPHAFGYQVDNGIPIESWFDDRKDKELLKLEKFLRTLHGVEDVREVVRNTFKTHLLVKNA